ncbi:MAG: nucleotidyltransferase domain-containing protein [Planctomycetota bacterium]
MLKELFSSKARVEVLKIFLLNPDKMFYQRGIASQSNLPIRAVQREVSRLHKMGLLEKSISGNRIYYSVNKDCPIYPDLKSIILKSTGIASLLKQYISSRHHDDIKIAFIYGSYARNKEDINSDIDLAIIGNINGRKVSGLLAGVKNEVKREINYVIYPESEFREKVSAGTHFLTSILKEPKIFLIGNTDDLKRIAKR